MTIVLIIITLIAICVAYYCATQKIETDKKTIAANEKLHIELQNLKEEKSTLEKESSSLKAFISEGQNHLSDIQKEIKDTLENQTSLSQKAFENYCDLLQKKYNEEEKEFDILIQKLNEAYSNQQITLLAEADKVRADLDKIKASRAAAIKANIKEKEIKENSTFYCLQLSDEDKSDIQRLENIKKTLNKPRVLSMLIWQTWYQKPLKSLAANVLGTSNDITGIYKITNIITNECYIGQAVSIATRWAEHAKCGLGIDTPAGNKLYKAMQEYGLYSFSWELLEACPKDQLNEKESLYISIYQSDTFGYNSNAGIKK